MKNNLTSLLTTTYDLMRYIHKYQHFASFRPAQYIALRPLPARTKLYAGGREGLFTVASIFNVSPCLHPLRFILAAL